MAGARQSASLSFPNRSTVSHQAAAAPGTVTVWTWNVGRAAPAMPSARTRARSRAAGLRPEPFRPLTYGVVRMG